MKIVSRYILREHLGPFIGALGVLTGLMLLNQLAKRFGDLVGKGLPWYVIGEVFALSVPFIVAMTMPMAVLVAVLYTFSRLAGDNEISAFKAGGISLRRLMTPVLIAASLIAGTMIWFNDRVLPESNHALRQLLVDIGRKQPTFELRERVINEVVSDRLFLQAARIERVRSVLRDLIIFDLGRPSVERTIYADSGYMAFNATQTDLYLTLFDGSIHERDSQNPDVDQHSFFDSQVIRVEGVSNELERGASPDWRGDREMSIATMRAEVRERRTVMEELADSVGMILADVTPSGIAGPDPEIAEPHRRIAEPDSGSAAPPDSANALRRRLPAKLDSAAARKGAALDVIDPDEPRERRSAERRPIIRAGDTTLAVPSQTPGEAIRRRIVPSRRGASWPPVGEPAAYAAQVRSELQRMASRYDMERRELSRYAVEIQKKYAIPVAAIVFVLIGVPIGVRFPRGGIGMVIAVSLGVFCVYYVFLIGGEDLADRNLLSPFWAMWAPNVIFAAVGLAIFYWVTLAGSRFSVGRVAVGRVAVGRAAVGRAAASRRSVVGGRFSVAGEESAGSGRQAEAAGEAEAARESEAAGESEAARGSDVAGESEAGRDSETARESEGAAEPEIVAEPEHAAEWETAGSAGARVDLNSADAEALGRLPGIGPEQAEAIVRCRGERGGFASVYELLTVPGIELDTLRQLVDQVKVKS